MNLLLAIPGFALCCIFHAHADLAVRGAGKRRFAQTDCPPVSRVPFPLQVEKTQSLIRCLRRSWFAWWKKLDP